MAMVAQAMAPLAPREKPRPVQDHVDPVPGLVKTKLGKSCPRKFTKVKTGWVGRPEKWLPRFVECLGIQQNKTEFGLSIDHFLLLDFDTLASTQAFILLTIFNHHRTKGNVCHLFENTAGLFAEI
jgi:hypothetical protein